MKYNKSNYLGVSLKGLHLHWGQHSYKGESYRSYSLARSIRTEGKNSKEIVIKLGKLSNEEVLQWKEILAAVKQDGRTVNLSNVFCAEHFDYLDVAVVEAYWNSWNLSSLFPSKGKRTVDVAEVAKILTINRCLDPKSKSAVPNWFQKTYLPQKLSIRPETLNSSRIFRELETIEASKISISSHIITKIRRENAKAINTLFFDLSTTRFSGTKSPLVEWGRSKEGYDHHAVLALLVTEDGMPLYWEVLKGGTPEPTTLNWLMKSVGNQFPIGEMTLVFDRGMVSDKNLKMLEAENRKYITAVDKNQLETLANFKMSKAEQLTIENIEANLSNVLTPIERLDDHTFVIEDLVSDDGRRYLLVFNVAMFKENKKARQKKIDEFKKFVETMNQVLESATNDRARKTTEKKFNDEIQRKGLSEFVRVNLDFKYMRKSVLGQIDRTRTFYGEVIIDEQAKAKAGKLDGFWMLVTNHIGGTIDESFRLPAKKILQVYRDKYVIEESFKDLKSSVEVSPVHVWKEEHVKAHYTICVLAHLINRTIARDLALQQGDASRHIISPNALFDELTRVKLNRMAASSTADTNFSLTRASTIIVDLLKRIGQQDLLSKHIPKHFNNLTSKNSV